MNCHLIQLNSETEGKLSLKWVLFLCRRVFNILQWTPFPWTFLLCTLCVSESLSFFILFMVVVAKWNNTCLCSVPNEQIINERSNILPLELLK